MMLQNNKNIFSHDVRDWNQHKVVPVCFGSLFSITTLDMVKPVEFENLYSYKITNCGALFNEVNSIGEFYIALDSSMSLALLV